MAAVTGAVVTAGVAAYTISNAEKQKREAKRALNNYKREELDNSFEEMPISTEGIEYATAENAVGLATAVDAARAAGGRGVVGAVPKLVAVSNDVNAGIAKYLDDMYNRRAMAVAEDNIRIEGMKENRDNQNINALSSQLMAAKQDKMNGVMGLGSAITYGARSYTPSQPGPYSGMRPIETQTMGTVPANYPITASPFMTTTNYVPPANPYAGENIFGDYFNNQDLINKYR